MFVYRLLLGLLAVRSVIHAEPCQYVSPYIPSGPYEYFSVDCGLTAFPGDVPTDITAVDISHNNISILEIPDRLSSLWQFDCSYNKLDSFPNMTSQGDTLGEIFLQNNEISSIDPLLLAAMVQMEILHLEFNLLTSVPDVTIPSNFLTSLFLKANLFTTFPTLRNLGSHLTYLDMAENDIDSVVIPDNGVLPKLQTLTLAFNKLDTVPDISYLGDTLTDLYLGTNSIESIPSTFLESLTVIELLAVGANYLDVFPDLTPIGDTLETLSLPKNLIESVPDHLIRPLAVIKSINIGRNYLKTLPDFTPLLDTLTHLAIYRNDYQDPIVEIGNLFSKLTNPDFKLDLSGLEISNIPSSLCDRGTIKELILKDTLLVCDCRLRWLKVATLSGVTTDLSADSKPCLGGPEGMVNVRWGDITLSHLQCEGKYIYYVPCTPNYI